MDQNEIQRIAETISQKYIERLRIQPPTASTSNTNRILITLESLSQDIYTYEDRQLLDEALDLIPLADLYSIAERKVASNSTIGVDDYLVEELAKWFKDVFMKWVNTVACDKCADGGDPQPIEGGIVTEKEKKYGASRVERSKCRKCGSITRFPRYGSVRKLLQTRRGRCGEWANVFTLMLRAIGQESRYIWNSEDHVWCEYYSERLKRWVHVDSCEAARDKPSIYERGWGKSMKYCIGFSVHGVKDVTRRYVTRPESELPRDLISEDELRVWITAKTNQMRAGLDLKELQKRDEAEEEELRNAKNRAIKEDERKGRQSGSLEWRSSRKELGNTEPILNTEIVFDLTKDSSVELKFNGDAYMNQSNGSIVLTENKPGQTSSVYLQTKIPIRSGFMSTFSFRLNEGSDVDGADGFAFVIQNSDAGTSSLGEGGCGLAYSGIDRLLAIEFDTYQSLDRCQEPETPHIAVHYGKNVTTSHHTHALAFAGRDQLPPINDGRIYNGKISYSKGILTIYLDDSQNENSRDWTQVLSTTIDDLDVKVGLEVFVGFTASTGGLCQRYGSSFANNTND